MTSGSPGGLVRVGEVLLAPPLPCLLTCKSRWPLLQRTENLISFQPLLIASDPSLPIVPPVLPSLLGDPLSPM